MMSWTMCYGNTGMETASFQYHRLNKKTGQRVFNFIHLLVKLPHIHEQIKDEIDLSEIRTKFKSQSTGPINRNCHFLISNMHNL